MIADTARTTAAAVTDEKPKLPEHIRQQEAAAAQREATRTVAAWATRVGHRLPC